MSRPLGGVQRASSVPTGSSSAGDRLQALGHAVDPLGVQLQPVEHGAGEALGAGGRHVAGVGGQDGGLALAHGGGGGQERRVLGGARGQGQHGGSGPGGLAQGQHLPLERVLQDGGHDALPRLPGRLSSKPAHAGQVVLGRAAPRRTSDVEACVRRRRRRLGQRR